ncbi:MAG: SAC family polyphosphoinositide phosphatase, partial [Terriglobus roseus]|nr:SAC family polyphosphoinositide phosphatase [Terriglobus roseus]
YLISISDREQVASIRGRPIYVVNDVALIPLSSQAEAHAALKQAKEARQRRVREGRAYDPEDLYDSEDLATVSEEGSLPESPPTGHAKESAGNSHKRSTSFAEDVINKKGMYGRFADRWFSSRGWSAEGRRKQGMSSEEHLGKQKDKPALAELTADDKPNDPSMTAVGENVEDDTAAKQAEPKAAASSNQAIALLPRILRTAKIFFGSKSFFFSYEFDLSRNLTQQHGSGQGLNLHNSFDPLFFWNRQLLKPFADAGQQAFTMPLLQGFVGQRAFALDSSHGSRRGSIVQSSIRAEDVVALQGNEDAEEGDLKLPPAEKGGQQQFLLTTVSRRSVKRAGLRYLRRGVDAEGNVANCVETEQILSTPNWGDGGDKIYSLLQMRGSIPLFFSQSPYSFKPVPVFYGSQETNAAAFKKHFQSIASRYGKIQAASLVDKHGTEASIGQSYQEHAEKLNAAGGIDDKGALLEFEWFDFHAVCRGMKFENVSKLIDTLRPSLVCNGWTVEEGGGLVKRQTGVLRTNCMDCLDRTNVVQSAVARNALEQQLNELGFEIDLQTDPSTAWFNSLWADNGDAISRQYA